jgi:Ca2+-dependent lipid-binding protein
MEESFGVEKEVILRLSKVKETNLSDLASSINRDKGLISKIIDKLAEQGVIEEDFKHQDGKLCLNSRMIKLKRERVKIKNTYERFVKEQQYTLATLFFVGVFSFFLKSIAFFLGSVMTVTALVIKNLIIFRKDSDYRGVFKEVVKKAEKKETETGDI